ncbi:hypothetical protein BH11PSE9_BH11PSE9_26720 [soil metagenome]
MGFQKCSGCKKWYDTSSSGCLNAGCDMADRAGVAKVMNTPIHPMTKTPMARGVVEPVKRPSIVPQPKEALPEVKLKSIGAAPLSAPVAIAAVQGQPVLDNELNGLEAGYHILYRGDSRSPAQIKGSGGFSAWVPLDAEGARQVVRRGLGQNFPITLPTKAARLQKLFNSDNCQSLTLLTLARQIKLEKAGDTFHISTDPSEGCGGYSSGYIYAMRFATMYLVDKKGVASPANFKGLSRVNTKLVMDNAVLASAGIIAVAIDPEEVAFLTTIPVAQIYKYKEPNGKVWYKMPV